jgi:hypothetical protein
MNVRTYSPINNLSCGQGSKVQNPTSTLRSSRRSIAPLSYRPHKQYGVNCRSAQPCRDFPTSRLQMLVINREYVLFPRSQKKKNSVDRRRYSRSRPVIGYLLMLASRCPSNPRQVTQPGRHFTQSRGPLGERIPQWEVISYAEINEPSVVPNLWVRGGFPPCCSPPLPEFLNSDRHFILRTRPASSIPAFRPRRCFPVR